MPRPLLPPERLHPAIRDQAGAAHADLVAEVDRLSRAHPVLVVGMRANPFVGRARRALDAAGVAHHDLDIGGYLSEWRRRNALKLWTGWPTFPMVFVRGQMVGGAEDLGRLIASGELRRLLDAPAG